MIYMISLLIVLIICIIYVLCKHIYTYFLKWSASYEDYLNYFSQAILLLARFSQAILLHLSGNSSADSLRQFF